MGMMGIPWLVSISLKSLSSSSCDFLKLSFHSSKESALKEVFGICIHFGKNPHCYYPK